MDCKWSNLFLKKIIIIIYIRDNFREVSRLKFEYFIV